MAEQSAATPASVPQSTDLAGLVWGFRFDEDGAATPLDGPAALAAMDEATPR